MDVRCERCKTLYELDEARVSEAGTTVRCTSCGHVFRVRKKVLLMTEAVGAGGESAAVPPPIVEKPPWRVRSPNGRVIAFRELTSMQKWIVERKFGRDDEISLHGDHWKRLGDIAELQPFFLLLEEVDRVHELEERLRKYELPDEAPSALERALSPLTAEPVQPTPTPIRLDAPIQPPPEPAAGNGFAAMGAVPAAAPEPSAAPERRVEEAPPLRHPGASRHGLRHLGVLAGGHPARPPAPRRTTRPCREGTVESQPPAEEADQPEFTRRAGLGIGPNAVQDTDDWEPARPSSKAPWVAAVLIVGALAVAAAAYFQILGPGTGGEAPAGGRAGPPRPGRSGRAPPRTPTCGSASARPRRSWWPGWPRRADAGTATTAAAARMPAPGGALPPSLPGAPPSPAAGPPPRSPSGPPRPRRGPRRTTARGRGGAASTTGCPRGTASGNTPAPGSRSMRTTAPSASSPPGRRPTWGRAGRSSCSGDSRSAITAFRRALGINSRYSVAEFWLGEAYRRAGQKPEAVDAYGRYLEAAPEGAEAAQAREALNGLP